MRDKPRHVRGDRGVEAQKPREMKRFHTEKWISTLVPAPKRSTLGVVAALDSVVGLCAGIESNISKNKDTQLYVHSDCKSCAFTKMSQEERCGKAERATFSSLNRYAAVCQISVMQNETVQRLKGNISNIFNSQHENSIHDSMIFSSVIRNACDMSWNSTGGQLGPRVPVSKFTKL